MSQLADMLRRRIGGMPAWVWALVIAGGIVGYAYLTRRDTGPIATPAPVAPPYADETAPADSGDISGVPSTPPGDIEITTNSAWVRYVTDRLVAEGLYGAVEVTNALTKALAGIEVTEQEAAIYNLAVRRFGAPPEGAPPISVIPKTPTPKPPPPATTKPAAPHLHHVLRTGKGRMSLNWYGVAGATGYVVYYTGGPKNGIPVSNVTSYTISGLPSGKRLAFSVASRNAAGRSATTSNVVSQVVS